MSLKITQFFSWKRSLSPKSNICSSTAKKICREEIECLTFTRDMQSAADTVPQLESGDHVSQPQPVDPVTQPQPVDAVSQPKDPVSQPQPVAPVSQPQPEDPVYQPQQVDPVSQPEDPVSQPQPVALVSQLQPVYPVSQSQPVANPVSQPQPVDPVSQSQPVDPVYQPQPVDSVSQPQLEYPVSQPQPEDPVSQPELVHPQSQPTFMKDVGKFLTGETNFRTLCPQEKLNIIDHHFKPGEDFDFPRTYMNNCNRAFRHQWLTTYPWLFYSKEVDGGFCLPCVLFATKEKLGVLVNTPFTRWTKVGSICGQHQQNNYHSDAQVKYDKFLTNARQPEKNIQSHISVQRQGIIKQNREVIKSVAKCIDVCGKMGLALRGHRDDSTADPNSNKGVFQTLVKFRTESGDEVLKKHLETCGKNATYLSKTVQNELIDIMGEQIRDDIIGEVKKAKFYSILCDEVTDCANIEQLTIVLRFVDETFNIREEFVLFCSTERITGEVIANAILSKLTDWGLDIENCRGQGYDGAANMSSARVGVQGQLCRLNPLALYTHCCSHILNLVIVKACTIPMIRNMSGTITETADFFNNSAKRQRLFEKVIDRSETNTKKKNFRTCAEHAGLNDMKRMRTSFLCMRVLSIQWMSS